MIKVVFFDVDGTLLSHKTKSVPQSTRAALTKLQAAGIKCVVATGRHFTEMMKLPVADLSFDGYVTLNGQLVLDEKQDVVYGAPMTGKAKDYFVKLFTEKLLPTLLVEKDSQYLNFVDDRVLAMQEVISSPVPALGTYSGGQIYQVCAYFTKEDEPLLAQIASECVITHWASGGVDIIAKGGGKVVGIRQYLEILGVTPEETIAFGDAENDLDMLQFCGIGVAMGNAEEAVKQVADYITSDVDDDGIANALKHFGLI